MADPGILSSQIPAGEDHVMRRIADLERAVREMRAADILRTAGLIAAPNLLTVTGGLVVDGSETVNGPLAVHGTATFDGDTTIGGNAAITGTLSLPAGIIDNAALANPIQVQSIYLDVSNFVVTTSYVSLASATITVPAGFTSALVTVSGQVGCFNPHTTGGSDGVGGDFLLCRPNVGTTLGIPLGTQFPGNNWWGHDVTLLSTVRTGLSGGGTFSVGISASVDYANMAAFAANEAVLSGNILWFR